jgi:hypothetical protein
LLCSSSGETKRVARRFRDIEEVEMNGFEIMTWIAALLFVMMGLGFPERDGHNDRKESGFEMDGLGSGHKEGGEDRVPDS